MRADVYDSGGVFSALIMLRIRRASNILHGYPRKLSPFPQINIIGAMVIVWKVRGKIIGSVLYSIVCNNYAQCNAHTFEQT